MDDCPVCGLQPDNKRSCCPPVYPCEKCGKPQSRTFISFRQEGGTTFTVCDECREIGKAGVSCLTDREFDRSCDPPDMEAAIKRAARMMTWPRGTDLKNLAVSFFAARSEVADLLTEKQVQRAEIEALKAERDEFKKQKKFEPPLLADLLRAQIARQSVALRSLNKGIHRLRKGRDNAHKLIGHQSDTNSALRAEVARMEGLIVAEHDTSLDSLACCGREASHAEGRAIKARTTGKSPDPVPQESDTRTPD